MSEVQVAESTKRFLVQVNYKSGKTVEMWCEEFNIKHNSGVLTSLSYTTVGGNNENKPLFFGSLESIESVYQLKYEEVVDSQSAN